MRVAHHDQVEVVLEGHPLGGPPEVAAVEVGDGGAHGVGVADPTAAVAIRPAGPDIGVGGSRLAHGHRGSVGHGDLVVEPEPGGGAHQVDDRGAHGPSAQPAGDAHERLQVDAVG